MKKIVLFQLFILLFACNQTSENNGNSDASKKAKLESKTEKEPTKNEEEIVSDIRVMFKEINQNSVSYETKSMEITGESTEGGELKSYYQNEQLKKVVASYFGEMGKTIEEYYFSEDNVFFVFTQQYTYDKPMYVEGSKVDKIDENRYYFHNSKLVRWLDPSKEKVSNSNFNQKESEILQEVKDLKKNLRNSKVGNLDSSKKDDDYIDMKSLFSMSPLSIFDKTTEGLSLSEKNDLLKKGESASWKIMDKNNTKLALQCKNPCRESEVTLYFLKNKNNLDGVLFAQIVNGQNVDLLSWKYLNENKNLQKTNLLKKYSANDFVSKEDKLPDSYEPVLYYIFADDQKMIEVSLHTRMEKEFENREIINQIFLTWNGENFEERIERIKK